ncbi:hypothetical protein QBC37DRAFT_403619 [Rhypophila decipiens]|uniref:Uncharacterized protein n=1 Tax=Rhypophila decipiens TaxID=261697 RepID=A0AAN7B6T3_9PEZI|nr:hypothetical protein QBC37DRAFT_403619 [Rhypophila decipiens]
MELSTTSGIVWTFGRFGTIVGKTSKSVRVVAGGSGSGMTVGKISKSVTVSVLAVLVLLLAELVVDLVLNPSPHRLQVKVIAPDSRKIMPNGTCFWVVVGFVLLAEQALDGVPEVNIIAAVPELDHVVDED